MLQYEEILPPCEFKIGDRVTSRKIGYPMQGRVIGIMPAVLYCPEKGIINSWDTLYDKWIDEYVVYVMTDTPQRSKTIEEFKMDTPQYSEMLSDLYLNKLYMQQVPESYTLVYPIQDLVLLEKALEI